VQSLCSIGLLSEEIKNSITIYGSYDELIADPQIDAIYIPLPSILHVQWATKVAESGKHLLVDKPTAINCAELLDILFSCQMHGVVFLDGVMFMHHERLQLLRRKLCDPFCGPIKRVVTNFSFNGTVGDFLSTDIRTKYDCDPLGALGDLGWYCIRLGIIAFNKGLDETVFSAPSSLVTMWPVYVIAKCNNWNSERVPLDCEATVLFSSTPYIAGKSPADLPTEQFNDQVLQMHCSFLLPFRQSFEICSVGNGNGFGDKIFRCNDFVIPRNQHESSFEVETFHSSGALVDCDTRVISTVQSHHVQSQLSQESNMFITFSKLVQQKVFPTSSSSSAERYWKVISLLTQLTVDSCMVSMENDGRITPIDTSVVNSFFG